MYEDLGTRLYRRTKVWTRIFEVTQKKSNSDGYYLKSTLWSLSIPKVNFFVFACSSFYHIISTFYLKLQSDKRELKEITRSINAGIH